MNRNLWIRGDLTRTYGPAWPCPTCRKGRLRLDPESLRAEETTESKREYGRSGGDPDSITYLFSAWLKCTEARCGENVVISGYGGVEPTWDEDGTSWEDRFRPRTMWPMPHMIEIPPKCPPEVQAELEAAFRLYWMDASASMNRIRTAVERLMDHLGIKRRKRVKHGMHELNLHARIEEFQKRQPDLGQQLLAIKYAGNTGSHGSVKEADVLDALEIVEHVLAEVISNRSRRIAKLAKQLAKKHAPKRARKRSSASSKGSRSSNGSAAARTARQATSGFADAGGQT